MILLHLIPAAATCSPEASVLKTMKQQGLASESFIKNPIEAKRYSVIPYLLDV
jgi:hypothetical protein